MQIALSTVCLPELSWPEALAEAARAGFGHVELLMIPGWVHVQPDQVPAAELRRQAEARGVRLVCLHAGGLDGLDEKKLADSRAYLVSVLKYARELGVGLVNVNGGYTPEGFDPANRPAVLDRIGAAVRGLTPLLDELDLHLTLENHFHFQLQTFADYQAIDAHTRGLERIGFTVDTGHFTAAEVDMPAFIAALGQRVFHVHIKDHVGLQSLPLGHGKTDNRAVIAALRRWNYAGYLSVELEVHDRANAIRYVHEALPYMQRLVAMETR